MATRTKLLSGRNINTDSDFSKYIETVSEPGVIEGLQVSENSVAVGKCWVPCERTNGETIYSLVESFTETSIDTSGTGYVIVEIGQTYIDDGSLINEDGTGVATIKVVSELPTKNYLELAELNSGVITDSRNMIKKVGELNTAIESLTSFVNDLDDRVEALEKAGAIDHLEEQGLVGELYALTDTLFRQKTSALADCTIEDCHVGDVENSTEIHIQRIASGVESSTLKLKVKSVGSPTTNLKVEVREGIPVTVTANSEAYWYGDDTKILATGTLAYSNFSSTRSEVTFNLSDTISVDEGTLLDIVVYQDSGGTKVVNASNYYILACDSTQYSEGFSFVRVNGTTRSRSKMIPYCISNSFAEYLICKAKSETYEYYDDIVEFVNTMGVSYYGNGPSPVPGGNVQLETGRSYRIAAYINKTKSGRYNDIYFANAGGTNLLTMSTGNMTAVKRVYGGKQTPSDSDMLITKYGGMSANSSGTGDYYGGVYTEISPIKIQRYGSVEFTQTFKKEKPKNIKGLGTIVNCYLFGRMPDGSWWDGE